MHSIDRIGILWRFFWKSIDNIKNILKDTACLFSRRGIYNIMQKYDITGSIKYGRKGKVSSKIFFVMVLFWPLLGLFLCFGYNPSKYVEPNPCQKFQVILGFFKTAKMSLVIVESHNFQFRTFCCILTQYLECNLMIFKKLPKNSNSIYAKLTL